MYIVTSVVTFFKDIHKIHSQMFHGKKKLLHKMLSQKLLKNEMRINKIIKLFKKF